MTLQLLKRDWLVYDADTELPRLRLEELKRVRAIYIPEMVIRLHHELFLSRTHAAG